MKTFKKEIIYNDAGLPIQEIIVEEFNDCYKKYCMAWDEKSKSCKLFGFGALDILDDTEEE